MKDLIGIDAIEIYNPHLYVDVSELEKARNIPSGKWTKGLGCVKFSVADTYEDPATMGANAAYRLMQENDLKPADIGMVCVASESNYDKSKPLAVSIVEMLESRYERHSFEHVGTNDIVHACAAGGYAIMNMMGIMKSGMLNGGKALAITTDIARYDIGSDGEPTQGAAASASVITKNPRLVAFEPINGDPYLGLYTHNVPDFWRPDGKETPMVLGPYSDWCYQQAMKGAYSRWATHAADASIGWIKLENEEAIIDHVDTYCPHLPYSNQGKKFLTYVLRHEWRKLPKWAEILSTIGSEAAWDRPEVKNDSIGQYWFEKCSQTDCKLHDSPELYAAVEKYIEDEDRFRKALTNTGEFKEVFDTKLQPTLELPKISGNSYTTAVFKGLTSALQIKLKKGCDFAGRRIGMGFYGSGCTAMITSAIVQEGWEEPARKLTEEAELGSRRELSLEEYEALHRHEMNVPVRAPNGEFAIKKIGSGKMHGYRNYAFV